MKNVELHDNYISILGAHALMSIATAEESWNALGPRPGEHRSGFNAPTFQCSIAAITGHQMLLVCPVDLRFSCIFNHVEATELVEMDSSCVHLTLNTCVIATGGEQS